MVSGARRRHLRHLARVELGGLPVHPDARLGLPLGGSSLIELRPSLVETELRIAVIEFAHHLPLRNEIAHVDRRSKHAPRHERSDIGSLIGGKRPILLERRGHIA